MDKKYNFKITKESYSEFLISVASEKKYNTLQKVKDKVLSINDLSMDILGISVPLSNSIDADFRLISLKKDDTVINITFEYLGTSG